MQMEILRKFAFLAFALGCVASPSPSPVAMQGLPSGPGGRAHDCSAAEHARCARLADPLLKEPRLVLPDNSRDLDHVCHTWNQLVDCLRAYTERCFSDAQRRQFNRAVQSPIDSVHEMCTQPAYQAEYLQYASCIKSTVTLPEHCGKQYNNLVAQVSQGEAISRASLCCTHDRFKKCVAKETRRLCDGGVPEGKSVRFASQIIDKALSFLQDQCYDYILNLEDCTAGGRTHDSDQSGLSTSAWYSTLGRDLEAVPTGLTFSETGEPDDPQETRVTDISWLPSVSVGDPGTTDAKEVTSDQAGTGHTNVLGSRTRPSSYGRSSGWETSPASPAAPSAPPSRPDWVTTPLWQIYRETGENKFESRVPTTNRRYTTETWYPAAGSYVGNSVDEPNQLGLSKPKNSGAGTLVLGMKLLVFMAAILAIC